MGKLLSWVVLLLLAWLVIRLLAVSQRRRERGAQDPAQAGGASAAAERPAVHGEQILPCAYCGVFVPAPDTVRDGSAVYCGVAHRDAARANKPRAGGRG